MIKNFQIICIYFGMKNISFYFIKIMYVIYTIKLKIFKYNIYNNLIKKYFKLLNVIIINFIKY